MLKYNQISSDFNEELVRECRGIILKKDKGQYIAVCCPFNKFGNLGESYCPDIDWATASVQEKLDGSLIKLWNDRNEWHISTNGTIDAFKAETGNDKHPSFGSLVMAALRKKFNDVQDFFSLLDKGDTYMFELVSPYNRVVIPYSEIELYFIGCKDNTIYEEINPETLDLSHYFKMPKRYPLATKEEVQNKAAKLPWDKEGYVVCDANFNRVKIKSPEYVIAHHIRNNGAITTKTLIKVILEHEEAEFALYCGEAIDELNEVKTKMDKVVAQAAEAYTAIYGDRNLYPERRLLAAEVNTYPSAVRSFLFHLSDIKNLFMDYAYLNWDVDAWERAIADV